MWRAAPVCCLGPDQSDAVRRGPTRSDAVRRMRFASQAGTAAAQLQEDGKACSRRSTLPVDTIIGAPVRATPRPLVLLVKPARVRAGGMWKGTIMHTGIRVICRAYRQLDRVARCRVRDAGL